MHADGAKVRGEQISVREMAAAYREVYGEEPNIEHRGSLEDLYRTMYQVKEQNPGNIWAWMGM